MLLLLLNQASAGTPVTVSAAVDVVGIADPAATITALQAVTFAAATDSVAIADPAATITALQAVTYSAAGDLVGVAQPAATVDAQQATTLQAAQSGADAGAYIGKAAPVPAEQPVTLWARVQLNADRNTSGAIFGLYTGAGVNVESLRVGADGVSLVLRVNTSTEYDTGVDLVVGRWYRLGYTRSGNTHKVYVDGVEVLSQSATTSGTVAGFLIGSSGGAYVAADFVDFLVADSAYSAAQIRAPEDRARDVRALERRFLKISVAGAGVK